jgi:hypothetical protein
MENDVPHRPGKLYKAKTQLRKKQSKKKAKDTTLRDLA